MKLKLLDINEVTLETKDKLCKENISLVVDNTNITPENIKSGVSILGVNGTLQGGGNSLKTLLDATKSASHLFSRYWGSLDNLIQYNDTENVRNFDQMFSDTISTTFPLLNTSKATSVKGMFSNTRSDGNITIPLYDTSNVKDFDSMFGSSNVQTVPDFNTSNGENFSSMFAGCLKLIAAPNLNFFRGKYFSSMYARCQKLESVPTLYVQSGCDFSTMFEDCISLKHATIKFAISSPNQSYSYRNMFCGCTSLISVDINQIYAPTVANMPVVSSMFSDCTSLKIVIIRNITEEHTIDITTFMGCTLLENGLGYIYVPRNMITTLENATNWSYFSFRPLEDYTLDGTVDGEFDYDRVLNEVQLYTFTIDGVQFQADPGMTWSQWIDSSYNTAGVANKMGAVCNKAGSQIKLGNQIQRNPYAIVDGAAYTTA